MRWIITKDIIDDGDDNGIMSFDGPPRENFPSKKFRMFDDDGELYYEGIAEPDDECSEFEPLDDYGMPNAGCTEIKYFENGEWETL